MQRKETNYYDIDVDIDETLLKMGLVDDIFYVRDLKQRKLFLTANVDQFSIGDMTANYVLNGICLLTKRRRKDSVTTS